MDINKTVSLLQSQIPNQETDKIANAQVAKVLGNEGADTSSTDTSSNGIESQQSTGEEFSTFLTLLTAQIENQDPLAPLDSTQFVEQLATFSNLELQANGNQSLEHIASLLERQIELLTPSPTPDTPQNTTPNTLL